MLRIWARLECNCGAKRERKPKSPRREDYPERETVLPIDRKGRIGNYAVGSICKDYREDGVSLLRNCGQVGERASSNAEGPGVPARPFRLASLQGEFAGLGQAAIVVVSFMALICSTTLLGTGLSEFL